MLPTGRRARKIPRMPCDGMLCLSYFLTGNVVSIVQGFVASKTSYPSRLCDHEVPVSGGRTEFVSLCAVGEAGEVARLDGPGLAVPWLTSG